MDMVAEYVKRTRRAEERRKALHLTFRYNANIDYYNQFSNQAQTVANMALAYATASNQLDTLEYLLSLYHFRVVNFNGKRIILECIH